MGLNMSEPTFVTVPATRRQIARVLTFPVELVPHINWESIGRQALELGAQFDMRHDVPARGPCGPCTITFCHTCGQLWPFPVGPHTGLERALDRLDSFVAATAGKRLTYKGLIQ